MIHICMAQYFDMRKTLFLLFLFLLISLSMFGQTTKPDSAQTIIKAAVIKAQSSSKNIFLLFHATWCKWCTRLEAVLEQPEIKKIIDENYILIRLDVSERGDKIQAYENPGGNKILARFGGENSGLPFIVFLDEKGKVIANSNVMPKKENIGYPGAKEEITAFVKLLKNTAPHMTTKQRSAISDYLKKNTQQ